MVSKEFFRAVKERATSSTITSLKNKKGIVVKEHAGMEAICRDYYTELYSSPPVGLDNDTAAGSISESLTDKVNKAVKDKLARPFSEEELLQAAKEMATGKSPGLDGYAVEFYTRMWHTIGQEFTAMVNQSMDRGQLP
jgi:hypothetical protein